MKEKDCRKCVYFSGRLSIDPKFVWSSCEAGITNLTIDVASTCKKYFETIEQALEAKKEEYRKQMGWDKIRCPYCGSEMIKHG